MRAYAFVTVVLVLPLAGLLPTAAAESVALIDDFNDGTYGTGLAVWTAQSGTWTAANNDLRNSAACSASSCARISTPYTGTVGTWEWKFTHNSASSGENNIMRFHFTMSSSNPSTANGYYLFSNSAVDADSTTHFYNLIEWTGGVATTLIEADGGEDTLAHTARVDRRADGTLSYYLDGALKGTIVDTTYSTSSYIGLRNEGTFTTSFTSVDDITFTPTVPPSVTVGAPNGLESWVAGSVQTISWSAAVGANPLAANSAILYYSTAGCSGSWTQIASGLATTGSYSWTVPNSPSSNACVRASVADTTTLRGTDESNAAFSIVAATPPSVTVTKPGAGESITTQAQYTLQYSASAGSFPLAASPISITYSVNGGSTWLPIASGLANSGSHVWSVPNSAVTNAIVRVCAADDRSPANNGCGQVTFNIVAAASPSTIVLQPNGGESWTVNVTYEIKWGASAGSFPLAASPFDIYASTTGAGGPWTTLATGRSSPSYNWTINGSLSNNAFIRVCTKDDRPVPNSGCDTSDGAFSTIPVAPPTATVVAPNGGETLIIGSVYDIRWTAAPGTFPLRGNPISIQVSFNGSAGPWTPVAQNLTNAGAYSWTVPATAGCAALIRVRAEDDRPSPNIGSDDSDSSFCITIQNGAPQVSLVSPSAGSFLRGQVRVEWNGSDVNGDLVTYKVQTSADSGATWVDRGNISYTEGPSPQRRNATVDTVLITDRIGYRLRVNATDPNGSSSSSQVSNITIDNAPPASTHDQMAASVRAKTFNASWKGSDATSGIASFDVLVSVNGSAPAPWRTATPATSAPYNGTDGGQYGFTFIATDRAGNRESKTQPDIVVAVDSLPPVTKAGPLPSFVGLAPFPVPFSATDLPVNGSVSVDLWFRPPSKQTWAKVGSFNTSPATFAPSEVGRHEFYCLGTDSAGNVETKSEIKEAETFVDASAPVPAVTGRVFLINQNTATFDVAAHDEEGLAEVRLYDSWSADNISYTTSVQAWDQTISGGPKDFAAPAPLTIAKDGYHRIEAYARDIAGKEGRGVFAFVRLDTVAPTVVSADPSKPGAPTDAHVRIQFDESMRTAATEAALKLEGTTVRASSIVWSLGDRLVEFDLGPLPGNTSVKITIGSGARDLADNSLVPYEFSFTTIPTTGAIAGKVLDAGKRPVAGAALVARAGGVERRIATAADGSFTLHELEPGVYEVSVSAAGYNPAGRTVTVATAQTTPADFILEKELSLATIGLYSAAGIVALALLLGLVVLARRRSRCPSCSGRLRNGRCANCGYVKAREPKKGRAPVVMHPAAKPAPATLKTIGRKVGPWGAPATAGTASVPGPGVNVRLLEPVQAAKRADACLACGASIPRGEDWCPKCGQAVGSAEDEGAACPRCAGTMLEGICLLCGFAFSGGPEVSEEPTVERAGEPCPRCHTPLKDGARFCDSCGADLMKIRIAKEPSREAPGAATPPLVTPPPRAVPQPPPVPRTNPTPSGFGTLPPAGPSSSGTDGKTYCQTCGTLAPNDLPICDVCGEPLGK